MVTEPSLRLEQVGSSISYELLVTTGNTTGHHTPEAIVGTHTAVNVSGILIVLYFSVDECGVSYW